MQNRKEIGTYFHRGTFHISRHRQMSFQHTESKQINSARNVRCSSLCLKTDRSDDDDDPTQIELSRNVCESISV